ncbi:MAG: hypothetical protein KAU27_00150 [Desulfuromonadales bacterium]|nr:hypothetical protein [Desulfuromonadales bacterium]
MITKFFKQIPWTFLIPAVLLLGLAPFKPEPHLFEKLRMLSNGLLIRPVDIFDLCMHGTPLLLVVGKLLLGRDATSSTDH